MIGKHYLKEIALGIDRLLNAFLGGKSRNTVSARIGLLKLKHNGVIPWYHPLAGFIDWGLEQIDPNHSLDAIAGSIFASVPPHEAKRIANKIQELVRKRLIEEEG